MSNSNTFTFRATFERLAALALYIATAAVVAGGAIAMCTHPFAG